MTDLSIYNDKGLSGIINYGNTCYINASIQSLSHTLNLTDFFLSKKYLDKIKKKNDNTYINWSIDFTNQWYRLLNGLWEDNCTISPKSLFTLLKKIGKKKSDFDINETIQNDIQEFFILILDLIHTSVSEKKEISLGRGSKLSKESNKSWSSFFENDYSIIIDLFYGQIFTQIKDTNDNKIYSNIFQPICFFPLPIDTNIDDMTLYHCFDLYLKKEIIKNHDVEGEKKTIYKNINIYKFPKIMIIILNRFDNSNNKIEHNVDIPHLLDMTKYNTINKKKITYELYSICNHYGNSDIGHYTSYCKNNNQWYEFNDNYVKSIDILETKNAYCLFYKKLE